MRRRWGLTQALMTAGAPTVVSSQWVVNDTATRALSLAFYAHITNGYSPANALRQATSLIRSQKSWPHPFYLLGTLQRQRAAHQAIPSDPQLRRCLLDGLLEQVETRSGNAAQKEEAVGMVGMFVYKQNTTPNSR